MSAIRKIDSGRYLVDFTRLKRDGLTGVVSRFVKPERVEIDPFLVGKAVCATIRRCENRDVDGQLLVWNDYKVFLSPLDYEHLQPMKHRLQQGLGGVIRETLTELDAETVGDPVVRILVDEETEIPRGVGEVVVRFVANAQVEPVLAGEVTVRIPRGPRWSADRPDGIRSAEVTIAELTQGGALSMSWDGGEASIAPGRKVWVGRPHADAPADFVALNGASRRISSRQLSIENGVEHVRISRPAEANPVQVASRLLRRGGRLRVAELPVTISLSSGDLILTLQRGERR